MAIFPKMTATSLAGDDIALPNGEKTLILSFDKGQYPLVLKAMSENKTALNLPVISKRFILMKDSLFQGLNDHFGSIKKQTYPLFVDRIPFFKQLGLQDENAPVLVTIKADHQFDVKILK